MTASQLHQSSVDYTGLGAVAWELFSSEEAGPDDPFFRRIVEQYGEPALDIGCGSGRLLLPMLADGVDVSGSVEAIRDPGSDLSAIT